MAIRTRGVVRGQTIELENALNIDSGVTVNVDVEIPPTIEERRAAFQRLIDNPIPWTDEDDEIFRQIQEDRKNSHREIPE